MRTAAVLMAAVVLLDVSPTGQLLVFALRKLDRTWESARFSLELLPVGSSLADALTLDSARRRSMTAAFCGGRLVTWTAGRERQFLRVHDASGAVVDEQVRPAPPGDYAEIVCDVSQVVVQRELRHGSWGELWELPRASTGPSNPTA